MRSGPVRSGMVGVAVVVVLAGCGSVRSGTVVGKYHDDAYTYLVTQCLPSGSNPCGMPMFVPQEVPECWGLELRSGPDQGSMCVDKLVWDAVRVGQEFDAGA